MNWIAARTPRQLARLARNWTSTSDTSAYILPAWQNLFNAHSCPELEQATWFLVATGFLEAVTQQHHQQRNLLHTRFQGPGKLQLFQLSLRRRHSSSFWPFVNMETVEGMLLSQLSLLDTCMCACALSSVLVIDMSWIAAWTPHQLARLARHWTSTSDTSAFFQHSKSCSMEQAMSFLVSTGFLEAVTQQQQQNNLPKTRSEVSATGQLSQLSTLRRRHSFGEDGNGEDNGALTVVTGWHLHACPFFSTGDWYELD